MSSPKAPIDDRWTKDRVGRISWRRDETLESWEGRKAVYIEERDRKQEEKDRHKKSGKAPHALRAPLALHTLREVFGLSEFSITACFGSHAADYPGLEDLELRARDRRPGPIEDGVDGVRVDMFEWILGTYHTKRSEALCDLDCCLCPRARALNCAAQNYSAAKTDGYHVSIINPLEHLL